LIAKMSKIKSRDYTRIPASANIVLNIVMILISAACILPLLLIFMVSITDNKEVLANGFRFIPGKITAAAYSFIFKSADAVISAYMNSIFITIVGSIASLIVITFYAYAISRKEFKYKKLFTMLILFSFIFCPGLVPWYFVYVNVLHVQDTYYALILPYLMTPLYVLIMRTFFQQTLPGEILEAAKIDGASEFRIFARIAVPLCKPALATIGLFNVLQYWNDWFAPMLFITQQKYYTLQYLLYKLDQNIIYLTSSSQSTDLSQALANMPSQTARMAIVIIVIGPIIFAYPFFQRFFIEGITLGSIKG
jgi:putative aldouronate transport system permease protein